VPVSVPHRRQQKSAGVMAGFWAASAATVWADGVPLEDIADLVGHKGTMMTETVYRKVIVPELRRGAEVMDRLFR
jgi:hypothetical protein